MHWSHHKSKKFIEKNDDRFTLANAIVKHGGLSDTYVSLNEEDVYKILGMCL